MLCLEEEKKVYIGCFCSGCGGLSHNAVAFKNLSRPVMLGTIQMNKCHQHNNIVLGF
jgi:hypothetical protein